MVQTTHTIVKVAFGSLVIDWLYCIDLKEIWYYALIESDPASARRVVDLVTGKSQSVNCI